MEKEWKIQIIDVGYKLTKDVYIFRELQDGTEIMQTDGILKFCKYGERLPTDPTLQLSSAQLQAFANELANNGYKPKEGFMEGKFASQSEHLKDLRKLLKL